MGIAKRKVSKLNAVEIHDTRSGRATFAYIARKPLR